MKSIAIAMLLLAGAEAAGAQQPDSGSFFVRLGRDTIAVESYTRTRHQLVAEALLRTPVTRHIKLTATFNDEGNITWWEVLNNPVAGTPKPGPMSRALVTVVGDSVTVESWTAGQQHATRKFAAHPQLLPLQLPFYSTYELAILRARRTPADTVLQMIAANAPLTYTIKYPAADSVTLFHPQSGLTRIRTDKAGRLLELNNEATTFKVVVTRSQPVDLQPYSVRFAKADAEGKAVGFLSPRDTVDVVVGNATITIDYSRPLRRGRTIFGGIVPWDQVWRTGANGATQIQTNQAIEIKGTTIPAGKYTLWTLPSRSGWKLIVNKQTGQWGTRYDPAHDLARIDVDTETLKTPLEQFTIDVVQQDAAKEGLLTLAWDRTRVLVPFRVL